MSTKQNCPFCTRERFKLCFHYDSPPPLEVRLSLSGSYARDIFRCVNCGVFVSRHDFDLTSIYSGDYVNATYGAGGIPAAYQRIMALPPERSDNVRRVCRINEFATGYFGGVQGRRALDVGSGLGVFPARMKEAGWACVALDPDARAAEHARKTIGVEAVCADFFEAKGLGMFDLVSFNRVLEHVQDPVKMLSHAKRFLSEPGIIYVELPDGERAALDGKEREEFTLDHYYAFSVPALALLGERAGLTALRIDRVIEPSGKFSVLGFFTQGAGAR